MPTKKIEIGKTLPDFIIVQFPTYTGEGIPGLEKCVPIQRRSYKFKYKEETFERT